MGRLQRATHALAIAIALTPSFTPHAAQAGAFAPPSTTVTSFIGLMNELQKRGPYAYAYGPDAGGSYVVVGPGPFPPPYSYAPRHHRRHRRAR